MNPRPTTDLTTRQKERDYDIADPTFSGLSNRSYEPDQKAGLTGTCGARSNGRHLAVNLEDAYVLLALAPFEVPSRPMDLQACLPTQLRGSTITRIAAGLSGAGVYRVERGGESWVLKVGVERLAIQRAAAAAGLAPTIVHVDEERRAIVSAFVADRSFPAFFMTARAPALELLGTTLRRVHELPTAGVPTADPRGFLSTTAAGLSDFALPAFASETIARVGDEEPPAADRAPVLSHNDVNPTNLVYDGQRLLLLDWDAAGVNDPYFDLATVAVFLRMDDATCLGLLAAHDGAEARALPPRLAYFRRFVAALCGAMFLRLARTTGHLGDRDAAALPLAEVYMRLRAGTLSPATPDGKWAMGLALIRASADLA